jgi:hypothetical protein
MPGSENGLLGGECAREQGFGLFETALKFSLVTATLSWSGPRDSLRMIMACW